MLKTASLDLAVFPPFANSQYCWLFGGAVAVAVAVVGVWYCDAGCCGSIVENLAFGCIVGILLVNGFCVWHRLRSSTVANDIVTVSTSLYLTLLSPFANSNHIGNRLSFFCAFAAFVVVGILLAIVLVFLFLSPEFWIVVELAKITIGTFSPLKGVAHVFPRLACFLGFLAAVLSALAAGLLGFGTFAAALGFVIPLGSLVVVLFLCRPQKHLATVPAVELLGSLVEAFSGHGLVPCPFGGRSCTTKVLVGFVGLEEGQSVAVGLFEGFYGGFLSHGDQWFEF
mmetsp:Transcript_21654/g.53717  ORF Transcript_21654/g.53717 Transcript_21654/m.53717 type:complete len:283 (+) Transcript_21654:1196-2044(+)